MGVNFDFIDISRTRVSDTCERVGSTLILLVFHESIRYFEGVGGSIEPKKPNIPISTHTLTSRVKLYEQLGWESLSDRRICRRVLQIHKIVDEKTPKYLQDCLPPNRNVIINLP